MFDFKTAVLSDVQGYYVGDKINPDSGDKFGDNMLALLESELTPEKLFEITKDRKNGFCLENIMAAIRSATLTSGLDVPQVTASDLDDIIRKTTNEAFRRNYEAINNMGLDLHPVESFSLAYVIYLMGKNLRTIPNFPNPPIQYKDIIPTLGKANLLNLLGETTAYILDKMGIEYDMIATVEARGNFLAASLSAVTGKGIIPIRKEGKLPPRKFSVRVEKYDGPCVLEIEDCPDYAGKKVVVFDDVIGSGESDGGVRYLCGRAGAKVVGSIYLLGILAEGYNSKNIQGLFTFLGI